MKRVRQNKGFTLVELLISMALLSIIMLIVVQFMSTTTAANKRAKYNLKAQTSAGELMGNIKDVIAQSNYVRVIPAEPTVYEKSGGTRLEEMGTSTYKTTANNEEFDFDLVPDNYGNYVRNTSADPVERKVIIDTKTFQLVGEKKGTYYPLMNDLEPAGQDIRSFRCMKKEDAGNDVFLYTKPAYIYAEYNVRETPGSLDSTLYYVMYRFDYSSGDKCKVYMVRGTKDRNDAERTSLARAEVDALTGEDGLLTDNLTDFYLSCDAEGGAFMLDALLDVEGYKYNSSVTVAIRNTEVLTARPMNSFILKDGSVESSTEDSGWETPSTDEGSTADDAEGE